MPQWCLFIEQARNEENARRAAEEAIKNPPIIAPQAAQYQNSPLKIFGQHDQNTIDQMRNCMTVSVMWWRA